MQSVAQTTSPDNPMIDPWIATVERLGTLALTKLPADLHSRMEKATALVLRGAVWLEDDGTAMVNSVGTDTWYHVNGGCQCRDSAYAPQGYCKHRLGRGLYIRAQEQLAQTLTVDLDPEVLSPVAPAPAIRPEWVQLIHGKAFIRYEGLLTMAHERGLVSLKASFISVTETLALAQAEATFADGKIYAECADATPSNVNRMVSAHFARCALTRAKARALRDALNLGGLCTVEELDGNE